MRIGDVISVKEVSLVMYVSIEHLPDGRFGVVVGILTYNARGRGFDSRNFALCA
jgi:hypothetical protein